MKTIPLPVEASSELQLRAINHNFLIDETKSDEDQIE
jgi:hypothetical protein